MLAPVVLLLLVCVAQAFVPAPATTNLPSRHAGTTQAAQMTMSDQQPSRREFLVGACAAGGGVLAAGALPVLAADTVEYTDPTWKFRFEVPAEWVKSETEISGRRKLSIWASDGSANAFVAVTPVRGDYTSLGSFGTADEVSNTLIPNGNGITGSMLSVKSKNLMYYYDYTIAQEGRPEKHLRSVWSLVPGDALVTVTAQCDEADYEKYAAQLATVLDTFKYVR